MHYSKKYVILCLKLRKAGIRLIALYVILAILSVILLLFLFVLFSPLSVRVKYDDGVEVVAGISFIKIRLVPGKEKKQKQKKTKTAKKAKQGEIKPEPSKDKKEEDTSVPEKKKSSLKDTLTLVFDIVKSVLEMMGKKAKIKVDGLNVVVSKPDAADTAIQFGICNGLVSTFLAFTSNFGKSQIKSENISVVPDFVTGKSKIDVDITLSVRTVSILLSLLKGYMKNQSKKSTEREDEK